MASDMVAVKKEVKCEEESDDPQSCPTNNEPDVIGYTNKINNEVPHISKGTGTRYAERCYGLSTRLGKQVSMRPLVSIHREILMTVLCRLTKARSWKEASGVLNILFKGTPRGMSVMENRMTFLSAMSILRRFKVENYNYRVKKIFEIWMRRLSWRKKCSVKKEYLLLELALFYLMQDNVQETYNTTKFLVKESTFAADPKINLINGLMLYQLWYSRLPEAMKINVSEIQDIVDVEAVVHKERRCGIQTVVSSYDNVTGNIQDNCLSFNNDSESSVWNGKAPKVITHLPKNECHDSPLQDFYREGSTDADVPHTSPSRCNSVENSIFFSKEALETSLLPLRLKHMDVDLEQSINLYRKLVDDYYTDAVKHLRNALYSKPPLMAALQPLVQILLLGDKVQEAFKVLEEYCNDSCMVLPFRLRARLLECFDSDNVILISSCYQNVLKIDPTCVYSLEKLIHLHKCGNYDTNLLLENIASHLDAVDGSANTWEELASCFVKLLAFANLEFEDCISTNTRSRSGVIPSASIPKVFAKKHDLLSWKLRCRWWVKRHFSKNIGASETQECNWKLLASKAVCAAHLYGPKFEYTEAALFALSKESKSEFSLLSDHLRNSLELCRRI